MRRSLNEITEYLKSYDGNPVTLMEVCGTHTSVIARSGIKTILSPKIRLISGPGCPVCVTPPAYIDKLCELAGDKRNIIHTFGDMMKVTGTKTSLYEAKAMGGSVNIVYSPIDVLDIAEEDSSHMHIMAAVGFETTAPVYALMIKSAIQRNITNIKLLTCLKRMPPVLSLVCSGQNNIDGFIAPGNVAAVTGSNLFAPIADEFKKPFCVSGFTSADILFSIYDLIKQIEAGKHEVHNLYTGIVSGQGNDNALSLIETYFEFCPSVWRGIGNIPLSGYMIKDEYSSYSVDWDSLEETKETATRCKCTLIITGKAEPKDCPLFGKVCTPGEPYGACMVSSEGCCRIIYTEGM